MRLWGGPDLRSRAGVGQNPLMMTSFYELLGVQPTADKDEIRRAYQEKRALDGGTDAARLNEAWSVLSDPYQRGRYDQRLAQGDDAPEVLSGDDIEVIHEEAPRPKGFFANLQANKRNAVPPPQIVLPTGAVPAPNSRRLFGVLIDGFGFFAILFALQVLAWNAIGSPDDVADIEGSSMAVYFAIMGGGFAAVYLLVEVLSTPARGQTLGRRIAKVKIVDRATGALPTWAQAFKRALLPLLVLIVLFPLLQNMAFLIVLALVMWSYADAGKQGFHDKWAKTIAVDANPAAGRST